jgi:enoyl-CoA hydratase/carnithine racemase
MEERMTDTHVSFEVRPTPSGHSIGFATLDNPRTLNGLSLAMCDALAVHLDRWADDDKIVAVVLQGNGEKAFCAGGDLQALYASMQSSMQGTPAQRGATDLEANTYARDFFVAEYRVDHRIHTYPKPLLVWGHGIVMGGGIGLMAGARHRVVTERSRLAMPEITVGLFPDVGGSWLLDRVPARGGRFLALTGAPLNGADAIFCGLADHALAEARRAEVLDVLVSSLWSNDVNENHGHLEACLRRFAVDLDPGPFEESIDAIGVACRREKLEDTVAAIAAWHGGEDTWRAKAADAMMRGSPGSARLSWELQRRARHLSLAAVFRLELGVALHCAAHGDFGEGIRALLIDKDQKPRWQPATFAEATTAWAERFFGSPWPAAQHPLADLETGRAQRAGEHR